MARSAALHINIPSTATTLTPHPIHRQAALPESPGYFQSRDGESDESSFSFTRNGSQYLASPSSVMSTTSPMMTPLPFKMQAPLPHSTSPPTGVFPGRQDEKKRLSEYEFPVNSTMADIKGDFSCMNRPFIQLRPQRLQEHQLKSRLSQQAYVSKYASYTNSSQTLIRTSPSLSGTMKPSTNMALSMIEKEKLTFQYSPSNNNRDSLASPPPPYLYSDHGVAPWSSDHLSSSSPFLSGPTITPASLALAQRDKRSSLPLTSSSTFSTLSPSFSSASASSPVTRTAKELKRHSLPVTPSLLPSPGRGTQWPSAMTMTVASVTRPKLARTMPPQAIPMLHTGGDTGAIGSHVDDASASPLAVFTPRTTRLLGKSETDTLYSYRFSSEDGHSQASSPKPTASNGRGGLRGMSWQQANFYHAHQKQQQLQQQLRAGGSRAGYHGQDVFPGFWEDTKDHKMHWMMYTFGVLATGSALWLFLMAPALLIWGAVLPGCLVALVGAQYAAYRWRRRKHYKQRQSTTPKPQAPTTTTRTIPSAAVDAVTSTSATNQHAHSASDASIHMSVGSVGSDSFLEPHHRNSPPHILKAQFEHQYFRSGSSITASPTQFQEGYQLQQQHIEQHMHQYQPSPEYRQSWLANRQNQECINAGISVDGSGDQGTRPGGGQQRRSRGIQRQGSMSSIASSETVSSSSTSSDVNARPLTLDSYSRLSLTVGPPSSSASTSLPVSMATATMAPPPPAYMSKKCDEVRMDAHETISDNAVASLKVADVRSSALPEIASVGDLLSEFAVDFGPF
ncbi:hypothetical protein EDD11_006713 [Mortierella claussenii]|nr:hypothetical protein EDD11_006713 [Mortierella claussenii]